MTDATKHPLTRRTFFATTSAAALTIAATPAARADGHGEAMQFEITHTEEEWRAKLTEFEYSILREGRTEARKTSPLWEETRNGTYHCQGCGLHNYDANWKVVLDKGWVFFEHAVPSTVLFGIDGPVAEYGQSPSIIKAVSEVHCRRCSSHLGHHLLIDGQVLHCINGTSLDYRPLET